MPKRYDHIPDVIFNGIDIPVRGIDIDATVKLYVCLIASDDASRFRGWRAGFCIIQPAKDPDAPKIIVLKKDLVGFIIHRHGAINWIRISKDTDRRAIDIYRVAASLRVNTWLSKGVEQIFVISGQLQIRFWVVVTRHLTSRPIVRDLLDGDEFRRTQSTLPPAPDTGQAKESSESTRKTDDNSVLGSNHT